MSDELVIIPRKKPETLLEMAEQAVEDAKEACDCAFVHLQAAEERLRIVREHEAWKRRNVIDK